MERSLVRKRWLMAFMLYTMFVNLGFFSVLLIAGLSLGERGSWEPLFYLGGTLLAGIGAFCYLVLSCAYYRFGTKWLAYLASLSSVKAFTSTILFIASIVFCLQQWEFSAILVLPFVFGAYAAVFINFAKWSKRLRTENKDLRKERLASA